MKNITIAVTLIGLAAKAHAGLTTYATATTWDSAVPSAVTTQVPDPSPSAFNIYGPSPASATFNGVNFSAPLSTTTLSDVGPLFSGNPAVLASYVPGNNTADDPAEILITFPSPVTAFALDYGTFAGNSVTFTLGNGDSFTQGSTGNSYYTTPDFAGATDTTPFSTVLVSASDVVLELNDVSTPSSVPDVTGVGLDTFLALPFALQALRFMRSRKSAA